MQHVKICIVGAGPIGISLAVELKRRGIPYVQLEAGSLANTIAWYAPGTHFFSSPERIALCGVPLMTAIQDKATREEYLLYLRSLVAQFDLDISFNTRVVDIRQVDKSFVLSVERSHESLGGRIDFLKPPSEYSEKIAAEQVVLAIGDMHAPNTLGIPGEDLAHVSHYLREPHRYFRKRVLIVGGKNSAVEAAIRLYRAGAKVALSYRGAEFDSKRIKYWLYPELLFLIRKKAIRFLSESMPKKITDTSVTLVHRGNQETEECVDEVLLLTGYRQDKTLFEKAGVELLGDERRPHLNRETMETNIPNLFVVGTAVAGTQSQGVTEYIETSHEHIDRVVKHLFGDRPSWSHFESEKDFVEN